LTTGVFVRPRRWISGLLVLAALCAGCTVTDDFVQDVGTTRIVFVDPDLAPQSADESLSRPQAVRWSISEACLEIDDDLVDLVNLTTGCGIAGDASDVCRFSDSVKASPYSEDRCAGGLVVRANPDVPQSIRLSLTFTMKVWTAEPPAYLLGKADRDKDTVPNEDDNCPWVQNFDQQDENLDGIGDRCQILSATGVYVLDSDGDGVQDSSDNCVWVSNPGQENTVDVTAEEEGNWIDDGSGYPCVAAPADVVDGSTASLDISVAQGPVDLFQARNRPSYITVDFTDALDCDDSTGNCTLTVGRLRLCAAADAASALAGCR